MAKTNRIKFTPAPCALVPTTRSEAETLTGEIARLKLKERLLATQMDGKLKEIRANYEGIFSGLKEQIDPMVEALHSWAQGHPEEFDGKKSVDLLHALVGWRINPPSLKPLKGFTWAAVLERIRNLGRRDFIRTAEELNKDALLAARDAENLKAMYLQVLQDEVFFVEPKITQTEPRETAQN
jgi:phage host-nuclease inhibitor protein Gam